MQANDKHAAYAMKLSKLPTGSNPLLSHSAMQAVQAKQPSLVPHLQAIAMHPQLSALATNGAGAQTLPGGSAGAGPTQVSATDPTGASNVNRSVGWGAGASTSRRLPNVRHNILGFTAQSVASATSNVKVTATPAVNFKGQRIVLAPTVVSATGQISGVTVGVRPQFAASTGEPFDVYSPTSYGGEIDMDVCPAAIQISAYISNSATVSFSFYGAIVGEAVGVPYRPLSSKLQVAGLGATVVTAGATATITLAPQMDYTVRRISLTPGGTFSDGFIITQILCGVQNQLMSGDPIPASVFNDLFPLAIDLDKINAATNLQIVVQNILTVSAVFQGTTRGDVDPQDLAKWGPMQSAAYSSTQM